MKKISVLMTVAVAIWMMASCGGKTKQVPFDDGDSADIANADPTIYGVCGEGTVMNTLQLLTDTGDTLSIDLSEAQDKEQVLGGLQVGDRMAVMTNKDNGNCWHVDIDLNNLTGGNPIPAEGINVNYYISATSENGKTITKPFNAINGTLYSFTLTTSVKYDENMFDFSVDPIDEGSIKFSLDNALIREDTSEDPTGVIEIQESESPKATTPSSGWYTIDGMPLSTRPSAKGIYLFGGKKVVIK